MYENRYFGFTLSLSVAVLIVSHFSVFTVNFENISNFFLAFLLLKLTTKAFARSLSVQCTKVYSFKEKEMENF